MPQTASSMRYTGYPGPRISVLLVISLVLAFLWLPPWTPAMPATGLDASVPAALSHAFNRGWQFGADIAFTFGPYGFLYRNVFDPENYGAMMGWWLTLAGIVAIGVTCVASQPRRFVEGAAAILFVFIGLRSGIFHREYAGQYFHDALFLLVPLLLVIVHCFAPAPVARWLTPALVLLTSLVGLVKLSFALLGIVIVILLDVQGMMQKRYFPRHLVLFLASSFVLLLLAGQLPGSIPAYVDYGIAIVGGYGEGMQYWGPAAELYRFVGLALACTGLIVYTEWRAGNLRNNGKKGLLFVLAWLAYLFVTFKAGFVRHDIHAMIAWSGLAAGFALCTPRLFAVAGGSLPRIAIVLLMTASAALAVHSNLQRSRSSLDEVLPDYIGAGFGQRLRLIGETISGRRIDAMNAEYEATLRRIRQQNPLPPITGTVDIYPWDVQLVLAHRMEYRPRPVFQSMAVYTQRLAELNRTHLRGPRAASTLIFDVAEIDNRVPSMDEGQLWPDIIALYDSAGLYHHHLLLRRRATPRQLRLESLGRIATGWNQSVSVPRAVVPIMAKIRIDKTLTGRIVGLFFKAPPTWLAVTLDDGSPKKYTLVPEMARGGFLLSPLIESPPAFERLMHTGSGEIPSTRRPSTIGLERPDVLPWFYQDVVTIEFEAMKIEPSGIPLPAFPADLPSDNVAAAAAGALVSASSTHSAGFPVAAMIDGDRSGATWTEGGGWNDGTPGVFPDWVEISFRGPRTIDRVVVYTLQDDYAKGVEPSDRTQFAAWGVTAFTVEAWKDSRWTSLGSVTGNRFVKRTVTFPTITTDRIRVRVDAALDGFSRIVEIEARLGD